jgi:uncharacterized repeat protein (TIGR04138 family)
MTRKPHKQIEEIVREVGKYPLDAFVFIQECIGVAAEMTHGSMKEEEATVARWMAHNEVDFHELQQRYFQNDLPDDILQAIEEIGGPERMNRHVTGQQLCWAIRDTALERWGLMARSVLARWNITSTEDVGAIIFALVENGWLQKQPTDTLEDFDNVFNFKHAFDEAYDFSENV